MLLLTVSAQKRETQPVGGFHPFPWHVLGLTCAVIRYRFSETYESFENVEYDRGKPLPVEKVRNQSARQSTQVMFGLKQPGDPTAKN